MKGLAVLGSTGTIGEATLDVAGRHPDRVRVVALAAHSNHEALFAQVERHRPAWPRSSIARQRRGSRSVSRPRGCRRA